MKNVLIRFSVALVLVGLFVFLALHQLDYPDIGIDDANIFFVYAENFSQGHGFVFNIGGEKIEGFTSILWVLIASGIFLLSDAPEILLLFLNILLLAGSVAIVMAYIDSALASEAAQLLPGLSWYAVGFLLLVCAAPGYVVWTTITLVDTGLWAFLLTLTSMTVLRFASCSDRFHQWLFALLIALLLLTRPEAFVWSVVFIGTAWWQVFSREGLKTSLRFTFLPALSYVLVVSILTLGRLLYFGYPLPNTYYAKVSTSLSYNLSEGIRYLSGYWGSSLLIQLSLVCLFVVACRVATQIVRARLMGRSPLPLEGYAVLPVFCLTGLCVPVFSGGDHFGLFRFYQPVFPLLVLNILICWKYIEHMMPVMQRSKIVSRLIKSAVLILGYILVFEFQAVTWLNHGIPRTMKNEFQRAESGREIGNVWSTLFAHHDKYPSVGSVMVGGLKMGYSGEVVDLMGLNNTQMGHSRGDRRGQKNHAAFEKSVFYQLQPETLLPTIGCRNDLQGLYESGVRYYQGYLKGILNEPKFTQQYEFAQVYYAGSGSCVIGFMNRTFLSELEANRAYSVFRLN